MAAHLKPLNLDNTGEKEKVGTQVEINNVENGLLLGTARTPRASLGEVPGSPGLGRYLPLVDSRLRRRVAGVSFDRSAHILGGSRRFYLEPCKLCGRHFKCSGCISSMTLRYKMRSFALRWKSDFSARRVFGTQIHEICNTDSNEARNADPCIF